MCSTLKQPTPKLSTHWSLQDADKLLKGHTSWGIIGEAEKEKGFVKLARLLLWNKGIAIRCLGFGCVNRTLKSLAFCTFSVAICSVPHMVLFAGNRFLISSCGHLHLNPAILDAGTTGEWPREPFVPMSPHFWSPPAPLPAPFDFRHIHSDSTVMGERRNQEDRCHILNAAQSRRP